MPSTKVAPAPSNPTADVPDDPARQRRARVLRRAFMTVLSIFVLLGAATFLGVRTRTVTQTGGGYSLAVEHAAMTRPGLATPFAITVTKQGGFDGPVTVAVTSDYMGIFDENGLDPDPTSSTTDGTWLYWELEPPATGDTMTIDFDARLEPGVQWRQRGTVRVVEGTAVAVAVSFTTWVMP